MGRNRRGKSNSALSPTAANLFDLDSSIADVPEPSINLSGGGAQPPLMCRNPRGKSHSALPPTAANPFDIDSSIADVPEPSVNLSIDLKYNPSNRSDVEGWRWFTVEEVEDIIIKNLVKYYQDIVLCLANLGYDKPLALRAVLSNGHCYCSMDTLSNILVNTIAFINASPSPSDVAPFPDLDQLAAYSLDSLIRLVQQRRHQISHHNALWCLYMSQLDIARAIVMELPYNPGHPSRKQTRKWKARMSKPPTPLADHTTVTGICKPQKPAPRCPYPSSSQEPLPEHMKILYKPIRSHERMNIAEGNAANESMVARSRYKMEWIFDRMCQLKEFEVQLRELHDLAEYKALQAVQKLRNDIGEIKFLLDEGKVNPLVIKENVVATNSAIMLPQTGAVKWLSEKRDPSEKGESPKEANSAVSNKIRTQMVKREKERVLQPSAQEKQTDKFGDATVQQPGKITQIKQLLFQKETEVYQEDKVKKKARVQRSPVTELIKLRQEMMDREEAFSLGKKKHNAKESADISLRGEEESLQQKTDVDFQQHKDDNQKLEDEISCSKRSA